MELTSAAIRWPLLYIFPGDEANDVMPDWHNVIPRLGGSILHDLPWCSDVVGGHSVSCPDSMWQLAYHTETYWVAFMLKLSLGCPAHYD
jgi:hypothetical protein